MKKCIICGNDYCPTGNCQKYCSSCKESYFLTQKRKEIQKKYRDSDEGKKTTLEYRLSNFEEYMFRSAKTRAKKKNIIFDLDITDIVIPENCPYFHVPLTKIYGKGKQPFNPSIDRIDPTKGYIKGNIEVISYLANTMKNSATKDQLVTFAYSIINKFEEELCRQ